MDFPTAAPDQGADRRKTAFRSNFNVGNNTSRSLVVSGWVRRIEKDRNWSRALLGLPLVAPVDPAIIRWCRRLGSRSILPRP